MGFGLNRNKVRIAATIFLLVMQVNLVFVAGFHHHLEPQPFVQRTSTLRKGSRQTHAPVESADVCVVCQIVRHGAARPGSFAPTPDPEATNSWGPAASPESTPSYQPTVTYGRAPPLA